MRQLWPVEPLPGPVSPQQVPGGADDREAGGPARPRGHGPRHPHQPVRKVQVRVPQGGRLEESVAGREARRGDVLGGLQVREASVKPEFCGHKHCRYS